jgi:hypothetical protein
MNVRKGDNRKGAKAQGKAAKNFFSNFFFAPLCLCAFAVQDFMRFFSAPLCLCG